VIRNSTHYHFYVGGCRMRYAQWNVAWFIALIVAISATGAWAGVHYYEMAVAPDAEANPMTRVEDGFGGQGGLLGGTAAFADIGIGYAPGFYLNNLGYTYTIDMRVRADINPMGQVGYTARSIGVADAADFGIGIQIRKDGLWFVDDNGGAKSATTVTPDTVNGKIAVDLTSFREIRLVVNGGMVSAYDLQSGSGVFLGSVSLVSGGAAGEITNGTGGMHLNSLQGTLGTAMLPWQQNGDLQYDGKFTLDWLRIEDSQALSTEAPIAAPPPSGCGIVVGPNAYTTTAATLCYSESFSYTHGSALDNLGGWSGGTLPNITIDNNTVKIYRGTGDSANTAERQVTCDPGPGGKIEALIKVKGSNSSVGNMWNLWFIDANGNEFARWIGASNSASGRIASTLTASDVTLSGNDLWDELKVISDKAKGNTEFLYKKNGETVWTSLGTLSHSLNGTDGTLDKVMFSTFGLGDPIEVIYFDDLEVYTAWGASPAIATVLEGSVNPDPAKLDFTVENTGASTLNYTVTDEDSSSWLSLTNATGQLLAGESATVSANITNTTGLAIGTYTSELKFVDDCGTPSDLRVLIRLDVLPACQMRVIPIDGMEYNPDDPNYDQYDAWHPWCKEAKDYDYIVFNDGESPLTYTVNISGSEAACISVVDGGTPRTVLPGESVIETVTVQMDPSCPNPINILPGWSLPTNSRRWAYVGFIGDNSGCENIYPIANIRDRTIGNRDIATLTGNPASMWELIDMQYQGDVDPDNWNGGR